MTSPDKKEKPAHPGEKPIGITLPDNYTQEDLQRASLLYKQHMQDWEKAVEEYEKAVEEAEAEQS